VLVVEAMASFSMANSLYVRNLSPEINEQHMRDIFGGCEEIEKVIFKPYPNNSSQFYAQIDFASAKGITEGSKLSGTNIMGVACSCGVIDPVQLVQMPSVQNLELSEVEDAMKQEFERRKLEAEEDQRFRTVHIANIPRTCREENIRILAKNFGEVTAIRVEPTAEEPYALIEFMERGPAHVAKTQAQFMVDGRMLTITESRVFVDEQENQEKTVHFQNVLLDAMNMRSSILTQDGLKEKLDEVRKAASGLFGKEGAEGEDKEDSDAGSSALRRQKKRLKKEKKEKKIQKKLKKQKREEKKQKRQAKLDAKKKKEQEEAAEEAAEEDEELESDDEDSEEGMEVGSSSPGPVELDDEELEVVDGSMKLVVGSSSSSSSSSDDEDKKDGKKEEGKKPANSVDEKSAASTNGKKDAEEKVLDKEDVWDIDAVLAANVMDIEEEENRKRARAEKRKQNVMASKKVIIHTTACGMCNIPGCVRPVNHAPPHIDGEGSTLIVKFDKKQDGKKSKKKRNSSSSSSSKPKKKRRT